MPKDLDSRQHPVLPRTRAHRARVDPPTVSPNVNTRKEG